MPLSLLALAAGAFGIGTTEFIIMGLLTQVSEDLRISIPTAGTLISGYAIGVAIGAPVLTLLTRGWPRKRLLLALMLIFIAGNLAAVVAPTYGWLLAARVLTSLTHGTFFGVGAVVATGLVPAEKRASAIALMFSGLTLATLLGVPAGAWIGQHFGWRMAFAAVAVVGVLAFAILAAFVPADQGRPVVQPLRQELAVLASGQVWLGLGITVFGFAGVFALYTYVEPLLTQVTHMGNNLVTATLLLFGAGLAAGNLLGGKLADRGVVRALFLSVGALMVVSGGTQVSEPRMSSHPTTLMSPGTLTPSSRNRSSIPIASTSLKAIAAVAPVASTSSADTPPDPSQGENGPTRVSSSSSASAASWQRFQRRDVGRAVLRCIAR